MTNVENIKKLYECSEMNAGWYQTVNGVIDMCFSLEDETPGNKGNKIHCYITCEYEGDKEGLWGGFFTYWTPESCMPCDKDAMFKDFELVQMKTPNLLFQQEGVFKKLKVEAIRFITSCKQA